MPEESETSEAFKHIVCTENSLAYMGSLLSFAVSRSDTGGGLCVLIAHVRPGSEPPPHVHQHEHEIYHLLEGEVDFYVEGANVVRAEPGATVFLPATRAHALVFKSPARFLTVLHGVAGRDIATEDYLKAMAIGPAESLELPRNADRYATIDPEQMAKAVQLAADHDVMFLSPEEVAGRLPNYPGPDMP